MIRSNSKKRLLQVTFDIPGAQPGDRRYARVDRYLKRIGILDKSLKQVRLVLTDAPPAALARAIRFLIGSRGSLLILRVSSNSVVDCVGPGIQRHVENMIRMYGRR